MKSALFLICLVFFFLAGNLILAAIFTPYVLESGNFRLNDYELTRRDHPEQVWDKVFFGNSAVISGYREELSESGYINFGLDYGSMTDLEAILTSDEVEISQELVIGLNWAALIDSMETNPAYFWQRPALEPYCYYQRDRLHQALEGKLKSLVTQEPWADGRYKQQTKSHYFAALTEAELLTKISHYESRYWSGGMEGCQENLAALERVAKLCGERNIRLRVMLMPWNPVSPKPDLVVQLEQEVKNICAAHGLDLLDVTDSFDLECFHDLGHMNYEYGSYVFMEEVDPWLCS